MDAQRALQGDAADPASAVTSHLTASSGEECTRDEHLISTTFENPGSEDDREEFIVYLLATANVVHYT